MNSLTMIQQLHFSLKEIENLIENLIYIILIMLKKTKNEKYERKTRKTDEFDFCHFSLPMSHNEAIEFENAVSGSGPLQSEVVARWQKKIQDKSRRQSTVV